MSNLQRHLLCIILCYFFTSLSANAEDAPKADLSLQLASVYRHDIEVKDYWVSEKLDGIRARWDGSKLLTRNGNVIHAPMWFIADFPSETLDGELWIERQRFEQTASIVLRNTPSDDWQIIRFMLFDLPAHEGNFTERLTQLQLLVEQANSPYLHLIPQGKLANKKLLLAKLDELVAQGAEGLMLHHQEAYYQDGRSASLFKLKKHQDAEAKVIAHLPGKGKYHYMLGALLVELDDGLQFKIGSGFTDLQRQNPPPVGAYITFKYYGLTARGIPRFASFLRIKPED
ncbi:DNA ligase [Paraglaciecola sp. 25GB23A]|uniref:DNA ligase n=1 Tax=Paraglaciecola sp. 25GB23A TaxID=3156068 RepID=UPI0032AFD000